MAKEVCVCVRLFFASSTVLQELLFPFLAHQHQIPLLQAFSTNKYVASPRGNGIDCHRFWEAQYLGVIPVVEHSPLDALYEKTGNVLFIDKFADLTEDVLLEHYPRYEKALKERGGHRVHEILTKEYWRNVIEQTRRDAIHKFGLRDVIPRKRCWGLTAVTD